VPTPASLVAGWNQAALVTAAVSLLGAVGVAWVGERAVAAEPVAENPSPQEADAA
jgi:hypothetical protein